ncbi:MAG: restriction endonuclease subunit S [Betaproteobacteria bacterium]|nr:restriction endonuclease subunit S [Betaproteobacteria bacterium]
MNTCVLKDLIEISKDGEWGKGESFDDSVEMLAIRGTDFEDARFGVLDSVPRRHVIKRIADRKTLRPWDVLIEAAGGTKGQITGRTVILRPQLFDRSALPITCASFSRFIRFRNDVCDPEFMFWYLQYLYGAGFMHAYHTQHTGVSRFQWTIFSEREPLVLPSLAAQRRIASTLSVYDELIANNQQRIRILEEMARALHRQWFIDFRLPGGDKVDLSMPPNRCVPQDWEAIPFHKLLVSMKGGDWGSDVPTKEEAAEVGIVRGTDFNEVAYGAELRVPIRYIKASSLKSRMLEVGDVIVENSVNAKSRCIGTPLLMDEHVLRRLGRDAVAASFCKVFRFRESKLGPLAYLHLRHLRESKRMERYQNVATNGIGNFQSKKFAQEEHLALPKVVALRAKLLVRIASPLIEVSMLASQIANLRRTRDLLLPRLLARPALSA